MKSVVLRSVGLRSIVFCYCGDDAAQAKSLARFLETNCAVSVDLAEGRVRPGCDLVDAAADAISADVAVVLLSPESMPAIWLRERWEPVFLQEAGAIGTRVAFVLLRDCKFPALFRRKDFFDLSMDAMGGQRRLKRWLLGGNPLRVGVPEEACGTCDAGLEEALADRPGVANGLSVESAQRFANGFAQDFEGILRFNCLDRSRAGLLGDISDALGLRLTQREEKNREELRRFCGERRLLLIFDRLAPRDREFVSLGGLASVIFAGCGDEPDDAPAFAATLDLFAGWVRDEDSCLRALGAAQRCLRSEPSLSLRMQLGWAVTVFLRHRERLAEAYEILDWMAGWLREQRDTLELHRVVWEQSWILEHWGESLPGGTRKPQVCEAEQLSLPW